MRTAAAQQPAAAVPLRVYNKVYSVQVLRSAGQTIPVNQKIFFSGYPELRNIKIKALAIDIVQLSAGVDVLFTLFDNAKEQRITNGLLSDFDMSNASNGGRLRLINMNGVDLLSSYFIVNNASFTPVNDINLFNFNFYI